MNCRQVLNEYCQKNGIELPEYSYTYISEQKIGNVSTELEGIRYQVNGNFNSKKEANEDLARMILEKRDRIDKQAESFTMKRPKDLSFVDGGWENVSKELPKVYPEKTKNKIIILYADPSEENPYKEMFKILHLIVVNENISMENIKLIGFSRKSIRDNKFIVNFTHNTVCENPNNELIWFVAKNYDELKNSQVYIECNDQLIKEFLKEKLKCDQSNKISV